MSALETSITLDDVFVVVGAKRVPLAAELAGYLALEIAEGAGAGGDVDPKTVYIGEEGSVALVRKRDAAPSQGGADPGDAEGSVRAILARLLDASGSQTAALTNVARRRTGTGVEPLIEELEAALIPVNRAAGRRALARLAREVKRVTLGVGRNAALAPNEPPKRASSPANVAARDPGSAARLPEETKPPPRVVVADDPKEPKKEPAVEAPPAPRPPDPAELPTTEFRRDLALAALSGRPAPAAPTPTPPPAAGSDVDQLLASFGVSGGGEKTFSRDLKALVGLEPTPPPPGSDVPPGPASTRRPGDSDVEALLSMDPPAGRPSPPKPILASPPTSISPALANEPIGGSSSSRPAVRAASASRVEVPPTLASPGTPSPLPAFKASPTAVDDHVTPPIVDTPPNAPAARNAPTVPSARRMSSANEFRQPRAPRTDRVITTGALVILLAGAAVLYVMKPAFLTGHPTPHSSVQAPPAPTGPSPAALAAACRESLVVTAAPANAEVLLREGQAPVDVERMPVGARLEFVATSDGFAPKRAVVASNATWEPGADGKPRFELPLQLDKSRARAGGVDPWPPAEPGSEVGGKGSPGTVHVVTMPRGAEVWLLAGLGPDARIDDLPCSASDIDVLVAGPTTLRKRLHVTQADFVPVDGGPVKVATVRVK